MIRIKIAEGRIRTKIVIFKPGVPDLIDEYIAIWDSGSPRTCISQKVAKDLNLDKIGEIKLGNIHGHYSNTGIYACNIILPSHNQAISAETPLFITQREDCDVIVGLDIMTMGDLTINGYIFSFSLKK